MQTLIKWHMKIGDVALKLFLLNVFWIVHMIRGGIVFGFFPATATVFQLVRKDLNGDVLNKKLLKAFLKFIKRNSYLQIFLDVHFYQFGY